METDTEGHLKNYVLFTLYKISQVNKTKNRHKVIVARGWKKGLGVVGIFWNDTVVMIAQH